ncbi:ABC transporter permease [Butyrivibrio proteoclasticus]|uniref:ABC transporter permease n=1 Tax=Butyrivibrio proteoclasticus TaxID=43305 RepID=UPI00047D0418|nr:ABC transporter permease [Butyrivibrio proteoclasticus]
MRYIIKKFFMTIITLVVVSFCVFLAFSVIPGDPALKKLGMEASPELVAQVREEMGLNDPLVVRYYRWISAFVKGDFGTSYSYNKPVMWLIAGKIPNTIILGIMAFLITVVVSIPLGIFTAKHENGVIDRVISVTNQIIMAIPPFFSGILISMIFAGVIRLFAPKGYVSYKDNVPGFLWYLLFPAVALALPKIAMTVKMLRGSVLDEAGKDYTRTAYSRGNRTNEVLYRHVLKNAMIPVITFLGMVLADMVAGSIVVEKVFDVPGVSTVLINSISNRDYPVVQTIIMGIATIVIVINLLVDIVYCVIDPRIRIDE